MSTNINMTLRQIYKDFGIPFNFKSARNFLGLPKTADKKTVNTELRESWKWINKQLEKDEKKQIKKFSNVLVKPSLGELYYTVINYKSKSLMLTAKGENNFLKQVDLHPNMKIDEIYLALMYAFYYPDNLINDMNAKVIITQDIMVTPKKIKQMFKQGITNCLFKPIIEWGEEKRDTAKVKKTAQNWQSRVNKIKELEKQYNESGVSEDSLQEIANKLQIDISIQQPFQKEFLHKKSEKKPYKHFTFINTKLNHVELNQIGNTDVEYIEYKDLIELSYKLEDSNTYFTYTRDYIGINSITTCMKTYMVKQDYNEFVNKFNQDNGIHECVIDDVAQPELSNFVRQGCHANCTIDFIDTEDELGSYSHMDQNRAYKNYQVCKYYKGFLGKIHDFRKCDKIVDVGIYRIKNLVLTGKLKTLNDKMKIYNDNVYPSPELEFIMDNGGTFDIIEGCWGDNIYFDMNEPEWDNKEENVRWYCKYIGCMQSLNPYKRFYMKGSQEYIQNMLSIIDYDTYKYYGGEELQVNYKKPYNGNWAHIASFILTYARLNTLEQLMSMELNDIIRVCVDGIYHYGEYEMLNNFRAKPELIKENSAGLSYISNYNNDLPYIENNFRDNYKTELHLGPGGSGKTTMNLKDKGFVKPIYIAPSWKLARNKQKELGVKCQVHHNILVDDPAVWGKIARNNNVLIIDEVSMLDNNEKEKILNRFKSCKIVMCGDPGFQLDGFNKFGDKYTNFKTDGFDNTVKHTQNYRVKCPKLKGLLEKIRYLMEHDAYIRAFVLENFQRFNKKEVFPYKVEDMILTRTHVVKDKYTEQYSHLDKYYVTHTSRAYCKGEIVYSEVEGSEKRHAFTTHSIQGETAEANLYIDMEDMHSSKTLYTALSRARYYEQIFLVY